MYKLTIEYNIKKYENTIDGGKKRVRKILSTRGNPKCFPSQMSHYLHAPIETAEMQLDK